MNSIKNRSFNIRVTFDEDGNPVLGFVHSFYSVSNTAVDIRPVPDSTVIAIARKLGITASDRVLSVKRKSHKKPPSAPQQVIEFKEIS